MIGHMLPQTCLIERWSTRTRNASYILTPNWATVTAAEPCNLQQKSGRMTSGPGGTDVLYDAVLYVSNAADIKPAATDAAHGDRITCDGALYIAQAVLDQAGRNAFKKVLLKSV